MLSLKWKNENEYTTIASYTTGGKTPLGYIHIWAHGPSNFALDNIKILNKDKNPNLADPKFCSSVINKPADFNYQETGNEASPPAGAPGNTLHGFNCYLLIPISAGASAIIVCIGIAIYRLRGKRAKEGDAK